MDSLSFHSASDLAGGGGGGGGGGFDPPTEKPGHFKLLSKGFSPFYYLVKSSSLPILGHLVAFCLDDDVQGERHWALFFFVEMSNDRSVENGTRRP